jgi:hypothetical protein
MVTMHASTELAVMIGHDVAIEREMPVEHLGSPATERSVLKGRLLDAFHHDGQYVIGMLAELGASVTSVHIPYGSTVSELTS